MGPVHDTTLDLRVSDLLMDDLHWNKTRIEQFLPEFSSQIQCLQPSKAGVEDVYVWTPLSSGVYSTKSGYNSQSRTPTKANTPPPMLSNHSDMEFNWLKDVWSLKTAPKLKNFLWSIIQGALPIGAELQRRGMTSAALCPRCKEVESAMHVFFLCPFAKEVWRHTYHQFT